MADFNLEGERWSSHTITWSYATSNFSQGQPGLFSSYMQPGAYETGVVRALARWSAEADVNFVHVADSSSSNIRIGYGTFDGPSGILAKTNYNYYPSTGFFADGVTIRFDHAEPYNLTSNGPMLSGGITFESVATHEIGHALGLDHYDAGPSIMGTYASASVTGLTSSDIHGIQALYGSPAIQHIRPDLFGTTVHDANSSGGQVYALYDAIFDRAPDTFGFEDWAASVGHGTPLHDVAASFLSSVEGQSHLSAVSNSDFVEQLYHTALHRSSDPAGLQGWVSALNHGTSRADAAISFALSQENLQGMQPALNAGVFVPDAGASDVARLYYGIMGRAPDSNGITLWTDQANHNVSGHDIAQQFLGSAEYQLGHTGQSDSQFVDSLYVGALGRHADANGLQAWVNELSHGASHADVALGVIASFEAHLHLASVIENGWLVA